MKAEEKLETKFAEQLPDLYKHDVVIEAMHEYTEQVVKAVLERASKQAYNPTQVQSILETEYKDLIK